MSSGRYDPGRKIHERILTSIRAGWSGRGGRRNNVDRAGACPVCVAEDRLAVWGVRYADAFDASHQAGTACLFRQRWKGPEDREELPQRTSLWGRSSPRSDPSRMRVERAGKYVELQR